MMGLFFFSACPGPTLDFFSELFHISFHSLVRVQSDLDEGHVDKHAKK